MHFCVALLLLTTNLFALTQQQKQVVNFAFFYPFNSPEITHPEGYNVTEIIDYGVQKFNTLPIGLEYELRMVVFNSNCNVRGSIRAYIEMLQLPDHYPFIVGPACSLAANPVGLDITTTNILAVSYYAASQQFANSTKFPNFFRLYPSEMTLLNGRVNFLKSQGWNRVAIVMQSLAVFTSSIQNLTQQLSDEQIESKLFLIFDKGGIKEALNELFVSRYNILIGLFHPDFANAVVCDFYDREESQELEFVWLLDGWLPLDFYQNTPGCDIVIDQLSDHFIFFSNNFGTDNRTNPTPLGPNFDQFQERFNSTIIDDNLVYDSFSTVAAAIEQYNESYGANCTVDSSCLGDYNYSRSDITDRLRDILHALNFQGLTGRVTFTDTGDRIGDVMIEQFNNGTRQYIGNSSGYNDTIFVNGVMWRGGVPPGDGSTIRFSYISLSQFIVFACFAVFGIVSSLVYIILILIKWKHGAINANTPLLTLTTLFGSIVLYSATVVVQVPNLENFIVDDLPGYAVICSVINWMLTLGFTLTFYPLFLKMVFAFYIKEYKSRNVAKRRIKFQLEELHLLIILVGCVLLDVLYLLMWTAIPQIRFVRTTDMLSTIQDRLPELIIEYNCGVEYGINERIVISLVIVSKVLALVVAMIIAFDTRSLKFKKHRENVWVGIALYSVAVLGLIGIVCYEFILRQSDLRFGIVILCILAAVAATTNLLFVPLTVLLFKDRAGTGDYGVELGGRLAIEESTAVDAYKYRIKVLEDDLKRMRSTSVDRSRGDSKANLAASEEVPSNREKSESVL